MKETRQTIRGLAAVLGLVGSLLTTPVVQAAAILNPYAVGPATTGHGLNAEWVQVNNDWRFSNYVYEGERIGDTAWGTGFWAVGDIATAMALPDGDPNLVARQQSVTTGLNYANAIYNTDVAPVSGWAEDYVRALAPVVASSGQQENYAASFSGYIYIPEAGVYDFGIFVDDAFSLSIIGSGGSLSVGRETLINSPGRDFYTLSGAAGTEVAFGAGFYGIELDYFNRLEAGVLELGWWQPGQTEWTPIAGNLLYTALPVPEPSSALLMLMGVGALVAHRRRRTA